jgi:hypothetical protein
MLGLYQIQCFAPTRKCLSDILSVVCNFYVTSVSFVTFDKLRIVSAFTKWTVACVILYVKDKTIAQRAKWLKWWNHRYPLYNLAKGTKSIIIIHRHNEVPCHKKERSYLISILFNNPIIRVNRRHRTDIVAQLLKSAQYGDINRDGVKRSRLMYKTFYHSDRWASFFQCWLKMVF